jgi:hypothetical protein
LEIKRWNEIIDGRTILAGDFNAHDPLWGSTTAKNNDHILQIIDGFEIYIANDGSYMRDGQGNQQPSIIDLTLSAGPEIESWVILDEEDHHTLSDHKMIMWTTPSENENEDGEGEEEGNKEGGIEEEEKEKRKRKEEGKREKMETSKTRTGWQIENMEEEERKEAEKYYKELEKERRNLDEEECTTKDIEDEAKWLEETLTKVLDKFAPVSRVCSKWKPWWNEHVREARKVAGRVRRQQRKGITTEEEAKKRDKELYRTIRRSKRRMWNGWLQKADDKDMLKALNCTKDRQEANIPTLRDENNNLTTTIEEKEPLLRRTAFPTAPKGEPRELAPASPGKAVQMVSEALLSKAIHHQSEGKAPGPDLLNFKAIRLLWNWNRERIINITRQCVRLGYHPKVCKTAKGVVIRKINKPDYSQPKVYRVICS